MMNDEQLYSSFIIHHSSFLLVIMYRLLIVDDSPYYRMRFSRIFARSKQLTVAGLADDGDVAIKRIVELAPDVVLLDLLMPRMDGFGVLRWVMENHPLPIIVCSSFSDRDRVFKALELGAIDFLLKPTPRATQAASNLEEQMIQRVEEAACAKTLSAIKISPDAKAAVLAAESEARRAEVELICIAASTGGPAAIQKLVADLPASYPCPSSSCSTCLRALRVRSPNGSTRCLITRCAKRVMMSL